MSKVARIVAKVASVVAIVAAVAAAVTGNPALAALLLKVSAIAGAVGAVAGTVAQMTAKKPPARGSPNLITIGANQPMPIVFGETYIGGNKVHEVGYGGRVDKVDNPYKFEAIVHSGCGPVKGFTGLFADFAAVALAGTAATGYFAGFLYADQQLGLRPESNQLLPNWAGAPDWGASHKLSGYAATGLSLKFDKDGKVFASGEPQWGVTLQGVKAYDARLDSTYPGGSGPQRIDDRSTWAYSENPGVIGATYAYGWFHDGKKQGGIGMPVEGIDMPRWVEFANVCDANGWKVGGVVYEPGSRWDNLKDICAAGGGEPYFDRHLLGVNYSAPRVSLDTITRDDIADDGFTVASGRTWRERLNTIAPKYRSAAHKWEYVPSTDVLVSEYITDDGEEKREEITWNLVQDKDQVAQLAAYELVNRREIGQIDVSCKPRLMRYSVGDMLTFDLPGTVIDGLDAIIIRPPEINPETGMVKLTMLGETDAKHDFALGKTASAPPVPALVGTDALDETKSTNNPSGDGVDGLDGQDGKLIEFAWKRAATIPPTPAGNGIPVDWSDDPPSGTDPLWLSKAKQELTGVLVTGETWSVPIRHDGPPGINGTNGTNGLNGTNGINGTNGTNGQTSYVHFAYADSADGVTNFTTGAAGGRFYIGTYTDFTATDSTNPAVYTWSLFRGSNGANGIDGGRGADGISTYVHIAYATNSTGTTGFSTTDGTGKTYIGTYTDTTLADSTNPALYTWSLIKGEDGDPGFSPVVASALPATFQFTADSAGTVKVGQLPKSVAVTGVKAGAPIGGTVTIISVVGCTATAISGGFTINTVFADAGEVRWRFTASDGQVFESTMAFSRQRDPASGGAITTGFSGSIWWGSGAYSATGPSTVLPASASGKLYMGASASWYTATPNGEATINTKLQYRIVGSPTWIDSGITGSGMSFNFAGFPGEPGESSPGELTIGATLTGLTAGASYEVQLVGSRSGATATSSSGYVAMVQEA